MHLVIDTSVQALIKQTIYPPVCPFVLLSIILTFHQSNHPIMQVLHLILSSKTDCMLWVLKAAKYFLAECAGTFLYTTPILVVLQVRMYSRALAVIGGFLVLASGAGEVYRQKARSRSLQSTGQIFMGIYLICMVRLWVVEEYAPWLFFIHWFFCYLTCISTFSPLGVLAAAQ